MTAGADAAVLVFAAFYLSVATVGLSLRRQALPLLAHHHLHHHRRPLADPPAITTTAASSSSGSSRSCGTLSGVALIAVSHSNPNEALKFKLMRWASVVNRRAYAAMHGWPLYVSVQLLDSSRHASWQKLVMAKV